MARKEIEEEVEDTEPKVEDLSVHVLDAMRKRGLKDAAFDSVKTIHLWDDNYRINCFKDHKIPESYFVRFSKTEGVLFTEPEIVGADI